MSLKLSKEKRNHLILVVIATAAVLGGLGFGLIRAQYTNLTSIAAATDTATKKLKQMQDDIRRSDEIENALGQLKNDLAAQEEKMASGDLYSWVYDTIRRLTLTYKVEIPVVNQPVTGECSLLPKFPYKQASLTLSGTGYYHDIGRFIADFENQYPQIRLLNLSLDPSPGAGGDKEKLEFKMDFVVLVRPNPS